MQPTTPSTSPGRLCRLSSPSRPSTRCSAWSRTAHVFTSITSAASGSSVRTYPSRRSPLFTQRAELSGALADRGRGHGTAEAGGRRTRALAEGEDVEVGERQRANQVERGAVIRVRLPREPGDHVRPETEDGEPLRQP